MAHLRNFEDAAEQTYFNSFRTSREVHDLLGRVASAAGLYKRYQKLRADYIGRTKAMPDVDPFYEINYVYGSLLALHYYEMYQKDPHHFVTQYNALLRNAFDAPPGVLLKKFLNIDLNDPQILSGPIQILTEKVNLLEKEYSQN